MNIPLAPGVRVAPDGSCADWLEARFGFGRAGSPLTFYSIVPAGFDRYARILHPGTDAQGKPVRWRTVADATGCRIHPEVQWETIVGEPRIWPPEALEPPRIGCCPREVAAALVSLLCRDDQDGQDVWMAVWEGMAGLRHSFPSAPRLERPTRDYLLFRASSRAVAAGRIFDVIHPTLEPGLWWPDDRSWCVATDVDLCWTYVGGLPQVVERVLTDPRLEAVEVLPEHRLDIHGDRLNAQGEAGAR